MKYTLTRRKAALGAGWICRCSSETPCCRIWSAIVLRVAGCFITARGQPIHPNRFYMIWRRFFQSSAAASLPYRKPHVLRHTFALMLIENGESLAYVRDQLGHASIKITVDTYGHLVPGANIAAVNRLDDPDDAQTRDSDASEPATPLRILRGGAA
ncbi:MAG TPA: tyrosine-type recombinase/integrase [Alphaproteobacteria bacterium]|nr:tyrosine-type recombinase/integrase [Alphaproteobacteria bacterium]